MNKSPTKADNMERPITAKLSQKRRKWVIRLKKTPNTRE
jgi:hypothetical protein